MHAPDPAVGQCPDRGVGVGGRGVLPRERELVVAAGLGGVQELAQALLPLGAELRPVLLRWSPPMGWLSRRRLLDGLVTFLGDQLATA